MEFKRRLGGSAELPGEELRRDFATDLGERVRVVQSSSAPGPPRVIRSWGEVVDDVTSPSVQRVCGRPAVCGKPGGVERSAIIGCAGVRHSGWLLSGVTPGGWPALKEDHNLKAETYLRGDDSTSCHPMQRDTACAAECARLASHFGRSFRAQGRSELTLAQRRGHAAVSNAQRLPP